MTKKTTFSTDLQWQIMQSLLIKKRKSKWDLRIIWEAICYVTKTGCQWRLLPQGYPPWQTVYWYFIKWTMDGTIEICHQEIRKALRRKLEKNEDASVCIIDSKGATQVFEQLEERKANHPKLTQAFADAGYRGKLKKWVQKKLKMNLDIIKRTDKSIKWKVQPKRWIIERTFAWLLNFRRLVINYERTNHATISYIYLAMICLMVKNIN